MKRLHTLFLLLTIAIDIAAQPICQVKHFSVSDGLAQGNVMSILQDQKGLVWFSTWNGLNKFDGYTFKTYKTSQESKYAFGSNRMGTISESKYGDIWCPTYDGQACLFDVETEKFIDVLQPIELSTKQTNNVTRIYSLEKGIAWILCESGYAFRVDEQLCKKGEGITLYSASNHNLKGNQIFNIYQDSEEDEWILTDKGVSIIGKKTLDTDFPFQFITQIKETIYLIAENDKLARYDFHTKKLKFVDIPYPHHKINNVTTIGKDMLALGTDNGVILYSIPKNSFQQIDIRTATQTSNDVESVYQDHLGDIWIFSKDPGIVHLNLVTNEKEHLFTPKDEIIKHGRKSRKLIFEDNAKNLWLLPTEGNFCYYDRKERTLKPLLTDINNPKSIFSPLVRSYTLDNQGNCWFATARGVEKLCFFPQSYQFNLTDYEAETRAFLQDSNKRLWTASKSNYIQIFAPDGNLVGYLSKQGNIIKEKQSFYNGVYSILEDKDGNIVTFSRGGSDVTGALVAASINADLYENWTDVSGFLMADPRIVENPKAIDEITYKELRELSYMGASVLHEDAIFPVRKEGIPINIRNTNRPEDKGTFIVESTCRKPKYVITGIAGKKGFCSINIEKSMMNSEVGFGRKVLQVFEDQGISFEHVPSGIDTMTIYVHQDEFEEKEQQVIAGIHRAVQPDFVEMESDLALIAVVGRGMKSQRGTAGRVFSALAHAHVNVKMIDQGSSELNIIIGVENRDFETAVKAIYDIFVLTQM